MVVGVPSRRARALKFMTVINISREYPLGACDRRNETGRVPKRIIRALINRHYQEMTGFLCHYDEMLSVLQFA